MFLVRRLCPHLSCVDVCSGFNLQFLLQLLSSILVLRIIQYIWASDIKFDVTNEFPRGVHRLARLASVETDLWSVVVFFAWAKLRAYLSRFKALSRLIIMIESVCFCSFIAFISDAHIDSVRCRCYANCSLSQFC